MCTPGTIAVDTSYRFVASAADVHVYVKHVLTFYAGQFTALVHIQIPCSTLTCSFITDDSLLDIN